MTGSQMKPISDWVFKRLFGDENNTERIRGLLKAVLDFPEEEFADIKIMNTFLNKKNERDKFSVLDLRVRTVSGKSIDVEIQVKPHQALLNRFLYYNCRMYVEALKENEDYEKLKQAITVVILEDAFFKEHDDYHSRFQMYDYKHAASIDDTIELHFLELAKLPKRDDGSDLWDWLSFFRTSDPEELKAVAERNEEVAKVVGAYAELTADEQAHLEFEAHEKARRDAIWLRNCALREGHAEGHAEGLAEGKQEIARKMLAAGIPVAQIADLAGLSTEEIAHLKL